MKKYLIFGFLSILALVAPAIAEENPNRPPKVEPIKAQLNAPVTTYTVDATDSDGDELYYYWDAVTSCGNFGENPGNLSAFWSHPNGEGDEFCSHDDGTSHDGTIVVYVSDGEYTISCLYEGSESGVGEACVMSGNDAMAGSGYAQGWDQWDEWIEFLIVVAVFGWFYFYKGSAKKKRICGDEIEAEARARRAKEQAEKDFNDIDKAKSAASDAEAEADKAKALAERARRAAGTRWSASGSTNWEGEHRELHREGWHDKEAGKKADEAEEKAKEAQEKADKAKEDFNSRGGDATWSEARSEKNEADDAWRKAKEALDKCLEVASAPVSSPTSTQPTTTSPASGGGASPTTGGPVTSAPPPVEPTQPRKVCVDGERRQVETTTESVRLLDLPSARLMQDRIYSDAGNEAMKFMDWLQNIKDAFMLGKRMKGGVDAYMDKSLTGAADAAGLPDFFTYYDKMVDALVKSMNQLAEIMKEKQQLGTYWLEYRYKNLTLTCTKYDVCVNGAWERRCELTVTDNGFETGRTNPLDVHLIQELQPVIRRLFNQLKSRFAPDKQKTERFTQTCR